MKGPFPMRLGALALFVCLVVAAGWNHTSADAADPQHRCNSGVVASSADYQAVAATVKLYFQGHATGNGDFFRQAFHPDAKLFWVKDGALAQRTSAEFVAG